MSQNMKSTMASLATMASLVTIASLVTMVSVITTASLVTMARLDTKPGHSFGGTLSEQKYHSHVYYSPSL